MQNIKNEDIVVKINISSLWRNLKIYLAIIGFASFVSIAEYIIDTIV